jgi:hypothetical protein
MRPTKSIASLVVAILVRSAWSTSSNAPQEGDACMLLTSAQVSAALGATVGGFKPEQEKEIEKSLALEILKKL